MLLEVVVDTTPYANHVRSGQARQAAGRTRAGFVADAALIFAGVTVEIEDTRKNYGEKRVTCYGLLAGRAVVVGYTPRGADRHVFSMRKANEREKARVAPLLEV